jgi:hypothetical protein
MALHRNQKRIDAIGWKVKEEQLLPDEAIKQLLHDFGDLEDASVELARGFDNLLPALENLGGDAKECWMAFLAIRGWFEELRMHMESAEALIVAICVEIERRHPHINPESDA